MDEFCGTSASAGTSSISPKKMKKESHDIEKSKQKSETRKQIPKTTKTTEEVVVKFVKLEEPLPIPFGSTKALFINSDHPEIER